MASAIRGGKGMLGSVDPLSLAGWMGSSVSTVGTIRVTLLVDGIFTNARLAHVRYR